MGIPSEALVRWLSRQLSDLTEEGQIHHFELAYQNQDNSLFRIEEFDAGSDEETVIDATEMAAAIHGVAEEDAKNKRGHLHHYMLLAYKAGAEEHCSTVGITIKGKLQLAEPMSTEPPNEMGITGQLMRHLEQTQLTMNRVVEASMGKLLQDNEEERRKRKDLESKREETFKLREALLNDVDEREAKRREEERKAERTEKIMGMFLQSMPLLLSAIASAVSSRTTPTSSEPDGLASKLKSFIKGVDEDELVKFMSALDGEKRAELMAIVGAVQGSEDSEKKD